MGRRFGKKNVIKVDPTEFSIGLMGESGVGKTTLAVNFCRKLLGDEGYIHLNIGKEDGISAISGAVYADIPDWSTLEEFVDDVIENKETDYPDLKMVIVDTIDQLFEIAEPESIRLHNRTYPDKPTVSIKQAWGGLFTKLAHA